MDPMILLAVTPTVSVVSAALIGRALGETGKIGGKHHGHVQASFTFLSGKTVTVCETCKPDRSAMLAIQFEHETEHQGNVIGDWCDCDKKIFELHHGLNQKGYRPSNAVIGPFTLAADWFSWLLRGAKQGLKTSWMGLVNVLYLMAFGSEVSQARGQVMLDSRQAEPEYIYTEAAPKQLDYQWIASTERRIRELPTEQLVKLAEQTAMREYYGDKMAVLRALPDPRRAHDWR